MSFYTAEEVAQVTAGYVYNWNAFQTKPSSASRHNEHNEVRRQTATGHRVNLLTTAYQKWLLTNINEWANECASTGS